MESVVCHKTISDLYSSLRALWRRALLLRLRERAWLLRHGARFDLESSKVGLGIKMHRRRCFRSRRCEMKPRAIEL